jgi:hypothetical protein
VGGTRSSRPLVAAVVAAVLALAFAGGAPARPAAGTAAKPTASLTLLSTSQANVLRLRYVRVRIRARRTSAVRLHATVRRKGARRAYTVTSRRLIRFRHRGTWTVRLRLNAAGRRVLPGCKSLSLTPVGRGRARGARRSRGLRGKARGLHVRAAACAGKAKPAPEPNTPPAHPRPLGPLDTSNADRCDFLDPSLCLYPWPNDHFTQAAATPTGRRLNISEQSVPVNRTGQAVDMSDQNRADGFSPGNMIVTRVPGLDTQAAFQKTGAVPQTDMARAFDANQPVVVINASTRQRQLIWAEIDSNPTDKNDVTLIIRPGKNFDEGERYIVALRRMRDASGHLIEPQEEFRAYRDAIHTNDPDIEARRAHYESLFATLGQAGIARRDLYLTWDFTVASEQSLTGRALSIRDDAFSQLGDTDLSDRTVQGSAPTFVENPDIADGLTDPLSDLGVPIVDFGLIDGRRDFAPCSAGTSSACEAGESDTTARRVTGTITVPCYLNAPGCTPGSSFNLDADGVPRQLTGNTATANVICTIPRQAIDGGASAPRARVSLYGHGLLGDAGEVQAGNVQAMGQEHNFVFCATDWIGMSTSDVPNVLTLLQDMSNFRSLVDRSQQGFLNFMYLGRWLSSPTGAAALPAFQVAGRSVIDSTQRLFYDGNSQGGILAGGLTALSPDFDRAVHGVPGMNYSTLLRRSVDFDTYAEGNFEGAETGLGLYQAYPNELERPLLLSLVQLLWDRGEADGYAHHMTTDPLPNTPEHRVLLHPAFGDHQVANVAAETEARTIGACAHRPAFYPGRSTAVFPLYGIPTLGDASCNGSGIVFWDTGPLRTEGGQSKGTPPAPDANVPPRLGNDPHSAPRSDVKARQQKSDFLMGGGVVSDPCLGGPCYAGGFTGP